MCRGGETKEENSLHPPPLHTPQRADTHRRAAVAASKELFVTQGIPKELLSDSNDDDDFLGFAPLTE